MLDELQMLNLSMNITLSVLLIISELLPFSKCKGDGIVHSISLHFHPEQNEN